MIDSNLVGMHFVIGIGESLVNIGRKYLNATKQTTGKYFFIDPYKYKYSVSEAQVSDLGSDLCHSTDYYSTYLSWKTKNGFDITKIEKELTNNSCQDVIIKNSVVEEKNIGMVKSTIKDTRDEQNLTFPLIAKTAFLGSLVNEIHDYTVLFSSEIRGTVIVGNEDHKVGDVVSWPTSQFKKHENEDGFWEILPAGVQVILENK